MRNNPHIDAENFAHPKNKRIYSIHADPVLKLTRAPQFDNKNQKDWFQVPAIQSPVRKWTNHAQQRHINATLIRICVQVRPCVVDNQVTSRSTKCGLTAGVTRWIMTKGILDSDFFSVYLQIVTVAFP